MKQKHLKNTLKLVSRFIPFKLLMEQAGISLVLPFYHTVSNSFLPHLNHLYPITNVKKFNHDIDFFSKYYTPIVATELIKKVKSENVTKEKYFYLSFDDGLREFYEVVAPILLKKGVPATCFINTDFIDNKGMFYRMKTSLLIERIKEKPLTKGEQKAVVELFFKNEKGLIYDDMFSLLKITSKNQFILDRIAEMINVNFDEYLLKNRPYLTSNEIDKLIEQGFTIGSHSMSHPNYVTLSEEEQLKETLLSIEFLKERFNLKEKLFSFPFTDFNVKKSFFHQINNKIDLTFGTANMKRDEIITNLQRIPMERGVSETAESILKSEYLLFILKKKVGKHVIYRE